MILPRSQLLCLANSRKVFQEYIFQSIFLHRLLILNVVCYISLDKKDINTAVEDLFPFASFLYVRIFGCCLSKRLKAWDEEHHVQKKDKMLSSCHRTNTKNDDIHCCPICAIGTPGDYHSFQGPFIYLLWK